MNSITPKQVIAEALEYALEENGLDDMGFDTSDAADIVLNALKGADMTVASL